MGGPHASSIDSLPAEVREALHDWLRDASITQAEATARVNALLAEIDADRAPVSKSAVNRYDLRMRGVGEKLRQSRAISEAWIAKLGSAPGGKIGHLVTEMLRTMVFELTLRIQDEKLDADTMPALAAIIEKLSLSAARLERASAESVDRERKLQRQAAEDLVRRAGEEGEPGEPVTTDRLRAIVGEIYGVAS